MLVLDKRQKLLELLNLKVSVLVLVKLGDQCLNIRLGEHFSKTSEKYFHIRHGNPTVASPIESSETVNDDGGIEDDDDALTEMPV